MKRIGTYPAGLSKFTLYLDPSFSGGHFNLSDEANEGDIVITLGTKDDIWEGVFAIFIHELTEVVYALRGGRYVLAPSLMGDNGHYMMSMSHTDFSESAAWIAEGIDSCYKELRKAVRKL